MNSFYYRNYNSSVLTLDDPKAEFIWKHNCTRLLLKGPDLVISADTDIYAGLAYSQPPVFTTDTQQPRRLRPRTPRGRWAPSGSAGPCQGLGVTLEGHSSSVRTQPSTHGAELIEEGVSRLKTRFVGASNSFTTPKLFCSLREEHH